MSAVASVSSIGCDRIGMGQKGACFVNRSFLGKSGAKCELMQPMHPAAGVHERTPRETDCAGQGKEANEGLLHYQRAAPQSRARPPPGRAAELRRPPGYNQLPSGAPSPPLRLASARDRSILAYTDRALPARASGARQRKKRTV
jgi:hypothetical protein